MPSHIDINPEISTRIEQTFSRAATTKAASKKRIFYNKKLWWTVFGVPNILSILYFGAITSPRYVSESSLVVYQANQTKSPRSIALQLSSSGGGVSLEGDYLAAEYIRSWGCFEKQNLHLMKRQWESGDFITRFGGVLSLFSATPTALWRYYQHHVTTSINKSSAVMTVRVVGYNRDFSQNINKSVLASADQAVNNINKQASENAESFFRGRVNSAQVKLHAAIEKLSVLQKSDHIVDPGVDYQSHLDLLNRLLDKKVTMQAQLKVFEQATPGSQRVSNLRVELQSLEKQINSTRQSINGAQGALTAISGPYAYQGAIIKNAEDALKQNEYQLLSAQQEALQHQYFMEYVSGPSAPPNPTQPNRLEWILAIMAATFGLYVVIK